MGLTGPFGSPVFAHAGKTDPPFRLILSQTSAGNGVGCVTDNSCLEHSFVRAFLPFLRPGLRTQTRRALGAVKAGRHAGLASRSFAARPRLDGPEHGARIKLVGASSICPDALEGATLMEYCPGNAGELVRERNRQHVVVQSLSCGLYPRLEPIAVPTLRPDLDQDDPGGLNEQTAQIPIAAPRYAAEDRAVASRYLFRHQPEPGTEVAAFREGITGADRSHHRARDDRANARDRHQPLAAFVLTSQPLDLAGEAFDALIKVAPVCRQLLDDANHAR